MSLKFARLAAPPLVIAVGAVGAFVHNDRQPVLEVEVVPAAPIVAPSVANADGQAPDGFAFGPIDGAPELVVVDALAEEEAVKTVRKAPVSKPAPEVAPEPAVAPATTIVASEALSLDRPKPSLALEAPDPRKSIRIDPTRDTARGGITTVSSTGPRSGGIRVNIVSGPGCRTPGVSSSATLVFDRGAVGISSVGGGYSRF